MREILFKAKRKDNGEWVEGYYCKWKQIRRTICVTEEKIVDCIIVWMSDGSMLRHEIDPDTLCQFTGLTDKNGKKIWENDILKANLDESYPEDITYIKIFWNECRFCANENYSTDIWTLEKWDAEHFQVCGNIFDNADLLEEE